MLLLFQEEQDPADTVQLECKEETVCEFDLDKVPSLSIPSPAITKTKAFKFDSQNVENDERPRSAIQFEKQQNELINMSYTDMLLPSVTPVDMPVKICSNVSPSATPKAFHSISELIRKDNNDTSHFPLQNTVRQTEPSLTLLTQQNINININDVCQSVLLFNAHNQHTSVMATSHSPPTIFQASNVHNMNGRSLLLMPTSKDKTPSSIMQRPLNCFAPSPMESSYTSFLMSGTSMMTGERSSSFSRIRFDDSKTEVVSDRSTKSEPCTPIPGSPVKKSILKKQVNDGMER